ncbi:MAG: SGNH/GDSL hydrolase family protein [Deltaproteobacteria bacterium]|nr:SGNH/GDSL hydrolase family protein [Deltaproteobacteria bacterium]
MTWISEKLYQFSHRDATREIRIVCIGDSMTDDMPEQPLINRLLIRRPTWTETLQSKLRRTYPSHRIFVHNHGARSKKISTALERMENPYEREDYYYNRFISMPSVNEINPDIIILESHGYMDHDTDYEQYVRTFKEILRLSTEEMGAQIYLLVTICPDGEDFKKPYEYYMNDRPRRVKEAELIRRRLEDSIQLGRTLGIPTIDVYSKTVSDPRPFIKEQDMVHPSYEGHLLIAEEVFEKIKVSMVFVPGKGLSMMVGDIRKTMEY